MTFNSIETKKYLECAKVYWNEKHSYNSLLCVFKSTFNRSKWYKLSFFKQKYKINLCFAMLIKYNDSYNSYMHYNALRIDQGRNSDKASILTRFLFVWDALFINHMISGNRQNDFFRIVSVS
jgi:hypothetical protein